MADKEKKAKYRKKHKEELIIKRRIYIASNRKKIKDRYRLKRYGLTGEMFDSLLRAQGGVCAICGTGGFSKRGPCVDHNHLTSKVRGILCSHCNSALGHLKDSISIAKKAIEYLIKNP
jgi:hypothetical protein